MSYTRLEDYIHKLFQNLSIHSPEQLGIESIAERLKLNVYTGKASLRIGNDIAIKEGTKQEEWQLFGHEVCHYLWHAGNHFLMPFPFVELQEWQANNFMYEFCVPTFMLDQMELPFCRDEAIRVIADTFCVERKFAKERLNRYEQKKIQDLYL